MWASANQLKVWLEQSLASPSKREFSSRLLSNFLCPTVSPGSPALGSHWRYGFVILHNHMSQFLVNNLSYWFFLWRTLTIQVLYVYPQEASLPLIKPLPQPCSPVGLICRTDCQEFFLFITWLTYPKLEAYRLPYAFATKPFTHPWLVSTLPDSCNSFSKS